MAGSSESGLKLWQVESDIMVHENGREGFKMSAPHVLDKAWLHLHVIMHDLE